MLNRATFEHKIPTVAATTMRPPRSGSILAGRVPGQGQHLPGQHHRSKHEDSTAIRGLRPRLGDLGCTIDCVGEGLSHVYPVGTEYVLGDLGQAGDVGRALVAWRGSVRVRAMSAARSPGICVTTR